VRASRLVARLGICAVAVAPGYARRRHDGREDRGLGLAVLETELVVTFFRPEGYAFEPTARRHAVAQRDTPCFGPRIPAKCPGPVASTSSLIIVDSLRADRMQVYGYQRPTTPFLAQMVREGRMKKVEAAFSTCSESFCGITSTLAGREFPDISPRTFQLQDVLRDEGYQTWFLLSGNHSAWNGLPQFYRASAETYFDGSQTRRYTMDDDRLVLEGLERVPPGSPDRPAFFYIHLMSTHYLGVQFPVARLHARRRPREPGSRAVRDSGAAEPARSVTTRCARPTASSDSSLTRSVRSTIWTMRWWW
jgi:hypothetical protein